MTKKHKWDKEIRALLDGERVVAEWGNGRVGRDLGLFDMRMFDYEDIYFQIKPKTLSINGHEFPEPLRVAPEVGTRVYISDITNHDMFTSWLWVDNPTDHMVLNQGFAHLTEEAAIAHAKATILAAGGSND